MRTAAITLLCGVWAVTVMTGDALAQTEEAFPLAKQVQADFTSTGLRDVVSFLSEMAGVSVVVDPSLDNPPVELKANGITVLQTLALLEQVVPGLAIQIDVGKGLCPVKDIANEPASAAAKALGYEPGNRVILLFKRTVDAGQRYGGIMDGDPFAVGSGNGIPIPVETCIYNLSPLLDVGSHCADDVAASLELVWKLMPEAEIPKLAFHEETKLLVVIGNGRASRIADQVIGQMPKGEQIVMQSILFRQNTDNPQFVQLLAKTIERQERSGIEALQRSTNEKQDLMRKKHEMVLEEADRRINEARDEADELRARNSALIEKVAILEAQLKVKHDTVTSEKH